MKKIISLLVMAAYLSACATYEHRAIPFRPPQEYGSYQNVSGMHIGVESFADKNQAEDAFGFDVRSAGLLPVQVVIDNQSGHRVEIMPRQTFLVDETGRYWNVLSSSEAVNRAESVIGNSSGSGTAIGAIAGTLLFLGLSALSGGRSGGNMAAGVIVGGATGAAVGSAVSQPENAQERSRLASTMNDRSLERKTIPPNILTSGFIFFPGEAKSAKELHLQFLFLDSDQFQTINLKLK